MVIQWASYITVSGFAKTSFPAGNGRRKMQMACATTGKQQAPVTSTSSERKSYGQQTRLPENVGAGDSSNPAPWQQPPGLACPRSAQKICAHQHAAPRFELSRPLQTGC